MHSGTDSDTDSGTADPAGRQRSLAAVVVGCMTAGRKACTEEHNLVDKPVGRKAGRTGHRLVCCRKIGTG